MKSSVFRPPVIRSNLSVRQDKLINKKCKKCLEPGWWSGVVLIADSVVLARGCSTIEQPVPGDCENHRMEVGEEKFCYCNQWLCNSSVSRTGSLWLPVISLSSSSLLPCWLEVLARLVSLLRSFLDKLTLNSVKLLSHLLTQQRPPNSL